MTNLNQAKQLKQEAGQLFQTISRMFLKCAIPQAQADLQTIGDEQARRLARLSAKAHSRFERRRATFNLIKWGR